MLFICPSHAKCKGPPQCAHKIPHEQDDNCIFGRCSWAGEELKSTCIPYESPTVELITISTNAKYRIT